MRALLSWPVLLIVVLADRVSKSIAESTLPPNGLPQSVVGDGVRFALVYNPGAAFGLYLGPYSRWIFMALTVGALVILWRLYRETKGDAPLRALAIAMVASGAIGNLVDRVLSERGVVDFIDVGFGVHRWPTFNIADMAVSGGACLLAYVLWGEEQQEATRRVSAPQGAPSQSPDNS